MKSDVKQPDNSAGALCEHMGLCTAENKPVFDSFMDHLPAITFFKDKDGRYLFMNRIGCELLNKIPDEVVGKTDAELWDNETASAIRLNDEKVFADGKTLNAVESIPVGPKIMHFRVSKFLIKNTMDEARLAGFYVDITDKVAAESENTRLHSQLLQAQKMEAIGTLAGGIAHDFNNLLAAIIGYTEIVRYDLLDSENVQTHPLDQVIRASERAKDLVNQILTFSRKSEVLKKPIRITPVIQEAMQLIRASLPSSIQIEQRFKLNEDTIFGDATQIHQVVINLCTNAAHAMNEKGGVMSISLDSILLSKADKRTTPTINPGNYIRLVISDTGLGMSSLILKRIFDPFFTTKEVGKGTGMGLSVVHGIVRDHGGEISVESSPGEGTVFQVFFPVINVDVYAEGVTASNLPFGHETILFVDDEKYLIDLGKQMLERLGYMVEARAGAIDAFEAFSVDPDKFDLVFTDLTMPNMRGDELARRIRQKRPDIPIIMCSGYGEYFSELRTGDIGINAFLKKPVGMIQVASTIRQILDQENGGAEK